MIPIRDDAPRYTTPYVNYFLIALNVLIFLFQQTLSPEQQGLFLTQFGAVPANITAWIGGNHHVGFLEAVLPVLTSMFLHGGWWHIIFNMWFLWIFGDNVEDHLGHLPYLGFYLSCGVLADLVHTVFNLHSTNPTVGASGAIAGVMGAYFLLYPSARVLTLVPFFFVFLTWLPAWIILGYWFVVQFLTGAASTITSSNQNTGGVAVWAHVGGFLAGLLLIKLFPARPQRFSYE
ncbi:MAG TPA: rhomboid family intramembrane serine protease [Terriglobales bacterium]|jgi:membrane associated rhomboid family serine protease|nr:rhomboid family intramembrane serine protease [Terriglobales bacterium]